MLATNRETVPFVIRDGDNEGTSLVAEWKIADARWHEIFAEASLKDVQNIAADSPAVSREARALDIRYTVSSWAGVPALNVSGSGAIGQQ